MPLDNETKPNHPPYNPYAFIHPIKILFTPRHLLSQLLFYTLLSSSLWADDSYFQELIIINESTSYLYLKLKKIFIFVDDHNCIVYLPQQIFQDTH